MILYNGALCLQRVLCVVIHMRQHELFLPSGSNIALFHGAVAASEQAEDCNLRTDCSSVE